MSPSSLRKRPSEKRSVKPHPPSPPGLRERDFALVASQVAVVVEVKLRVDLAKEGNVMMALDFQLGGITAGRDRVLATSTELRRLRMRPAIDAEIKAGVEAEIRAAVEGERIGEKRALEAEAREALDKQLRELEIDKQQHRIQVIVVQAQLINFLQSTQLPMHRR